jgi:ABC-type transporter MlaC component
MMRAALLLLSVLILAAPDAHAADLSAHTSRLVQAFKAVKSAGKGKRLAKADSAANKVAMARIDAWFDFPTFTTACMGKNAARFSPAETRRFGELLTGILRNRGYANGGRIFRDGKLTLGKVAGKGARRSVPMTIYFAKQDLTMESAFVYNPADKIIDLIIDGDSLTRDFGNQVSRMLKKKTPAKVLAKLEKKLASTAKAVQ